MLVAPMHMRVEYSFLSLFSHCVCCIKLSIWLGQWIYIIYAWQIPFVVSIIYLLENHRRIQRIQENASAISYNIFAGDWDAHKCTKLDGPSDRHLSSAWAGHNRPGQGHGKTQHGRDMASAYGWPDWPDWPKINQNHPNMKNVLFFSSICLL